MTKRYKKYILVALALLYTLFLVSACSNETNDTIGTTDSISTSSSVGATENIEPTESTAPADGINSAEVDNVDYNSFSYGIQLYRQADDKRVTYDDHKAPYESHSEQHIFSLNNMGAYPMDITMFVVLNWEIIPFSADNGEMTSFYNFSPEAAYLTEFPISFGIDESMLKYSMNQCDIITVMNIPIKRFSEYKNQTYFYNSFRFYFENKNSDKTMAPVTDTDNVKKEARLLLKWQITAQEPLSHLRK